MARDQALLDEAERTGAGFVRLYRWSPFCLSFGRNEPALRRYDRDLILRRGLDTVRRPTGGRAVWHARELTYAVAAPAAWFGTLTESYRAIHAALAAGLRTLGVAAELAQPVPAAGIGSGACFATTAGGEVTVGGRKLLGSAQLRQGDAFLQHGSLLLADDQGVVAELTAGPPLPGGEVTLDQAAGRAVTFEEAAAAIAGALEAWPGTWSRNPTAGLADGVTRHLPRFADPAWTWRR